MNFYAWWTESMNEIVKCPDKLKLIRLIVKQEVEVREMLGEPKLSQDKLNKLIALLELKYLIQQKLMSTPSTAVYESLEKCSEEIKKIRSSTSDNFEFFDGELEVSVETQEMKRVLSLKSSSNPIIQDLVFRNL
jgi:hypothetical protein